MGMWQGLLQGYEAVKERKLREEALALDREKFERTLLETRRGTMLEDLRERLSQARETRGIVQRARAMGLDSVTTSALLNSGQLEYFMERVDGKDISPTYIAGLNDMIMEQLGPDAEDSTLTRVLLDGVETDRDLTDPQQANLAAMEAILGAETMEDLEAVQLSSVRDSSAVLQPFDLNLARVEGLSLEDNKRIDDTVARYLSPYLPETSFAERDGLLTVSRNAPAGVASLFRQVKDRIEREVALPNSPYTLQEAIDVVTDPIATFFETAQLPNAEVAVANLDYILQDPITVGESFRDSESGNVPEVEVPEVPGGSAVRVTPSTTITPGQATQALGDTPQTEETNTGAVWLFNPAEALTR